MKKILLFSTLCMLLILNVISTPSKIQADERKQSIKVEKSVSDKGITFTINSYEKENGKSFIIQSLLNNLI